MLDDATWVVDRARLVRINADALEPMAERLTGLAVPAWHSEYHLFAPEQTMAGYVLALDTLNSCFWPRSGQLDGAGHPTPGYIDLALGLKRAFEAQVPFDDGHFLAQLGEHDLDRWLPGMAMAESRVTALRQLGELLVSDFGGQATELIGSCQQSAVTLARMLATRLASFADFAIFEGRHVALLKRAQIVGADLWAALGGCGLGCFLDIPALTCFADYKLPQLLRAEGVLEYAPGLQGHIELGLELEAGSVAEVEIRCATIVAVEMLRMELLRSGRRLNAVEVDWLLWHRSQSLAPSSPPHHRVRTVFY